MIACRFAAVLTVACLLAGCQTTDSRSAADQGPPPAGYTTWDEYWAAQDQLQRDFERDRDTYQMDRRRDYGLPQ